MLGRRQEVERKQRMSWMSLACQRVLSLGGCDRHKIYLTLSLGNSDRSSGHLWMLVSRGLGQAINLASASSVCNSWIVLSLKGQSCLRIGGGVGVLWKCCGEPLERRSIVMSFRVFLTSWSLFFVCFTISDSFCFFFFAFCPIPFVSVV